MIEQLGFDLEIKYVKNDFIVVLIAMNDLEHAYNEHS